MARFGPACPECGRPVPFVRTQWGLGKPFACKKCGAELVMPKSLAWLGLAAFVIFWSVRKSPLEQLMLYVALLLMALAGLSWLLSSPVRAAEYEVLRNERRGKSWRRK